MSRSLVLTLMTSLLILSTGAEVVSAGSSIGGGIHYLRTVGGIKDDPNLEWDPDSVGFVVSYQYSPPVIPLIKVEGDLEWVPKFGGGDNTLFQPQAYGLVGGLIYGGLGIGKGRFDGEWLDSFYALRLGVSLGLGSLSIDLNLNYRFQSSNIGDAIRDADLDQFTLGAVARFNL